MLLLKPQFTQFCRVGDIPKEFVSKHVRLRGRVQSVHTHPPCEGEPFLRRVGLSSTKGAIPPQRCLLADPAAQAKQQLGLQLEQQPKQESNFSRVSMQLKLPQDSEILSQGILTADSAETTAAGGAEATAANGAEAIAAGGAETTVTATNEAVVAGSPGDVASDSVGGFEADCAGVIGSASTVTDSTSARTREGETMF